MSIERGWSRESQYELLGDKKCDSGGTRTLDPRLKRQLLYQLSYRINPFAFAKGSKDKAFIM